MHDHTHPLTRAARWLRVTLGGCALVAGAASTAAAQLSTPFQGPDVEAVGQAVLTPRLAVVDDESTSVGPILGARYVVADDVSLHGHLGGLFGDVDAFTFGVGAKVKLLEQGGDLPVDLSGITTFGLAAGSDVTLVTWLAGPIVGHTFLVDSVTFTPYGGFGLGIAYREIDGPGRNDSDDTDLAAGLLFGGDVGLTRDLSIASEIMFGLADGLPDVNWTAGIAYKF